MGPLSNRFNIIYGSTSKISLKDQFVDKVIIMNAYHHFDNKEVMLKEIYRILKNTGKLIITDHISLTVSKESTYGCHTKYLLQSEKDFVGLIEKSGFKIISTTKMGTKTRQFVFEKK
jgi:ubiquinone/menaquinone biosynthesis C-methylase UbiE